MPLAEKTSVSEIRAGRRGSKRRRGLSAAGHAAARHRRFVPAGTDGRCGRSTPDHPRRKVGMRRRRASRSPKLAPKGARRGAGVERLSLWLLAERWGSGVWACERLPSQVRAERHGSGEVDVKLDAGSGRRSLPVTESLCRQVEARGAGCGLDAGSGMRSCSTNRTVPPAGVARRVRELDWAPKGVAAACHQRFVPAGTDRGVGDNRPSSRSFRQVRPRCERRLPASMHAARERSSSRSAPAKCGPRR